MSGDPTDDERERMLELLWGKNADDAPAFAGRRLHLSQAVAIIDALRSAGFGDVAAARREGRASVFDELAEQKDRALAGVLGLNPARFANEWRDHAAREREGL